MYRMYDDFCEASYDEDLLDFLENADYDDPDQLELVES